MRAIVLAVGLASLAAACGPKTVFRLSSDENNQYALAETLARRTLPSTPAPINTAGRPRVFALTSGSPKTIVAYDLATGTTLWKADADVRSRIHVGGDFVVALEGEQLVARAQAQGAPRWRLGIEGTFVGAAADTDRAYVVTQDGATWWLAAYDGASGKELWKADSPGKLGAPVAHGGVVYAPFLSQWLTIVDGRTGDQLTRVRGVDEQISMLQVTSQVAYYGSRQGVFRLDGRSASGKRSDASYGQVQIPPQLERTSYGRDAYDLVQQRYTASDRARVLWASGPTTSGALGPLGDTYAIHYFRYVLGFSSSGGLRWAYSNPRVELVSSAHTGPAILGVATSGDVVALDPETGAVRARMHLGTTAPVIGATFDAEGWAPAGAGEPVQTVGALVEIARDRDARFDRVKEFAVSALAKLPGPQVTAELLGFLADERAPPHLKDTVVDLLVERRDPGSLPVLTQQLAVHTDYLARTTPEALGAVARTIAGLGSRALDPRQVAPALAALQYHLDAPHTASADLVQVIGAMAAIGGGSERAPLASHLLLYRVDDDRGADPAWQRAIVGALVDRGGPAERVLLHYVAADPRTQGGLATMIRARLGED